MFRPRSDKTSIPHRPVRGAHHEDAQGAPFGAVRAFEAAARHLNFTRAADELCVTPSAVSHQIRTLEEYLGVALFLRRGNHIELTAGGRAYMQTLTAILDQLDASTRLAARTDPDIPLHLLCTPGFVTRWLAPNLASCPESDRLEIMTCDDRPSLDFTSNGADVVIAWGGWPLPGVVMEPLMEAERFPVCSPEFRARAGLARPEDLLGVPLLQDDTRPDWGDWFRHARIPVPDVIRGPIFPHCETALRAAEAGQGVALAFDVMARRGLESGRIVRLFDIATPPFVVYSVAYPEIRRRDPRIRAFRDWIFDVVAGDAAASQQAPIRTAS
jgi:LysR family glycine cleavage system transcriptional activator